MRISEYQELCEKTEPSSLIYADTSVRLDISTTRLLHHTIGICTEAGELQDALKKYLYYNQILDEDNLIEELGDLMWYICGMCNTLGVSLEEVMQRNHDKLSKRYPDGFSVSRARNRADKLPE